MGVTSTLQHAGADINLRTILFCSLLGFICFKVTKMVVDQLFRSPIRHIPGPLPAKLSSQWIFWVSIAGRRSSYMHTLHQRYGPVVRVGPNEVSFSSAAAARDIYVGVAVPAAAAPHPPMRPKSHGSRTNSRAGDEAPAPPAVKTTPPASTLATTASSERTQVKTFPKSAFYDILGRKSVFSMRNEEERRQRLKHIGHWFSPSWLTDMEGVMSEEIGHLLARLEASRGKETDVLYLFRMLGMDIIGHLFLGKSFDGLKSESPPDIVHCIDNAVLGWALESCFPWAHAVLRMLPFKVTKQMLSARESIYDHGTTAFKDYMARGGAADRRLPLRKLLSRGNSSSSSGDETALPLTEDDVIAEITIAIFGGFDTMGNALSYLFFELAQHPRWMALLRAELAPLPPVAASGSATKNHASAAGGKETETISTRDSSDAEKVEVRVAYRDVHELPVLDAVIWETLRVHPPVPTSLLREAPAGGAPVAGHYMPAGTLVSVAPYVLHRSADAFPAPHQWDPARWLLSGSAVPLHACDGVGGVGGVGVGGGDGGEIEHLRAHMMPFSRGARTCLGKGIALTELKLTVAAIVRRFGSVRLASEQTLDDMQMTDHFVTMPKRRRCHLVFE